MVGVAGFEPAASWTRTMRDTKLRHTPKYLPYYRELLPSCQGNSAEKRMSKRTACSFFLEAPPRFELGHQDFADPCLTTWLWRQLQIQSMRNRLSKEARNRTFLWSE